MNTACVLIVIIIEYMPGCSVLSLGLEITSRSPGPTVLFDGASLGSWAVHVLSLTYHPTAFLPESGSLPPSHSGTASRLVCASYIMLHSWTFVISATAACQAGQLDHVLCDSIKSTLQGPHPWKQDDDPEC